MYLPFSIYGCYLSLTSSSVGHENALPNDLLALGSLVSLYVNCAGKSKVWNNILDLDLDSQQVIQEFDMNHDEVNHSMFYQYISFNLCIYLVVYLTLSVSLSMIRIISLIWKKISFSISKLKTSVDRNIFSVLSLLILDLVFLFATHVFWGEGELLSDSRRYRWIVRKLN